ncbi:MbnP family copper-binding protein [Phreatobacter sp.]|uniref:MbnP family copper-binding protein n=1 Tax=Phreatobacter sp. TaxID=1966341 RepID=UPI0025D99A4B|nr:MbnP family copper-binding protein [Phreatobacter sp.]
MRHLTSALLAAAMLIAPSAASANDRQPVAIRFAGEFAGKPFSCTERYSGIGTTGSTVSVTDYRLYVSEVALLRADGSAVFVDLDQDGRWQHQNVALLDFENGQGACTNGTAATNDTIRGSVPRGDYVGLVLTVGVPFALNHADPTLAPSPLNLTAMFWNWQVGYKFIKVDLSTAGQPVRQTDGAAGHGGAPAAATPSGWSLHLGSTVCTAPSRTQAPTQCTHSNRIAVRFARFDAARNVVVIDPARVLAKANVDTNAPETPAGCMSFPNDADCLTVMAAMGLAYGGQPAAAQELLSVR